MPAPELIDSFGRVRASYEQNVRELIPLLMEMAIETVGDGLPSARELAVHGQTNEDWLPILRIQRVLDANGRVLFDVDAGDDNEAVEQLIDEVNVEFLDLLLDLTGDEFMDSKTISVRSLQRP